MAKMRRPLQRPVATRRWRKSFRLGERRTITRLDSPRTAKIEDLQKEQEGAPFRSGHTELRVAIGAHELTRTSWGCCSRDRQELRALGLGAGLRMTAGAAPAADTAVTLTNGSVTGSRWRPTPSRCS